MKLKKSQAIGIKELVATIVVAGILSMIAVVIFSSVDNATNSMMDSAEYADATATVENISETYYDSIQLAVVAIIVLAAAAIIGILIQAFGA